MSAPIFDSNRHFVGAEAVLISFHEKPKIGLPMSVK
jgi:hypothetical protein